MLAIIEKKPKSGPKQLYNWYKEETSAEMKRHLAYALLKLKVKQAAKLFVRFVVARKCGKGHACIVKMCCILSRPSVPPA